MTSTATLATTSLGNLHYVYPFRRVSFISGTFYTGTVNIGRRRRQRHQGQRPDKRRPRKFKMGQENSVISDDTPPKTLQERSLEAVAEYIKSGQCRKILVMTGAGISTAAGSKF
jgi:hypothetical protein